MIFKVISILGTFLVVCGGVLLWKKSPSGYGFGFYADQKLIDETSRANALMRKRQKASISLIIVGSVLQAVATYCS